MKRWFRYRNREQPTVNEYSTCKNQEVTLKSVSGLRSAADEMLALVTLLALVMLLALGDS